MSRLLLCLLACAALTAEGVETLVDAVFDGSRPLLPLPSDLAHARGVLPEGVKEDSGWAEVTVAYAPMQDPLGAGGWLRATIERCARGRVQLKIPLPPVAEAAYVRVVLNAASQEQNRVVVQVMDNGKPYAKHAATEFALQPTMGEYSFDAPLGPIATPVALILQLGTSGSVDLKRLRLERRSRAAVQAEIAARHPDGGPRNLLTTTHFPLGLPPGWSLGTRWLEGVDLTMRAQVEAPSPVGTIALRLDNADPARPPFKLWSAPFAVALAHEPHVLRFQLRGTLRQGAVSVRCDGVELARQALDLSPGPAGTVVALPFQPSLMGVWHQVVWEGRGNCGLDQLSVARASQDAAWQRQAPAEVAVQGRPETNQVFTADQPVELVHHASGDLAGCRLRLRVLDLDGRVVWQDEVDPAPGRVRPLAPAAHPLGSFRLEAEVVRGAAAVSPLAELVYHVVPPPRSGAAAAPGSAFGMHASPYLPHLRGAKALGANWARLHGPSGQLTSWSALEPQPGAFRFADRKVAAYREAGLSILGMLAECPPWARVQRQQGNAWLDHWWQPADLDAWTAYVTAAITHFAGTIDHWQIWNEPWGGFWFREWDGATTGSARWKPGPDPLGDYLKLSQRAVAAIRAANPQARIIGIDGTRFAHGATWLDRALAAGGAATCDVISFHSYHSDWFGSLADPASPWNRETAERIYQPIVRHLGAQRLAEPDGVWMTEGNATADAADLGLYRATSLGRQSDPALLRRNARRVPLYHLVLLSGGVDKVFLYAFDAVSGDWNPPAGKDWSVLVTRDGAFNAGAPAYAALTWHLEGLRFAGRRRLASGAEAFCFADEGRAVAAVLAGTAPWPLPVDGALTWRNLFGNPMAGSLASEDLAYATAADLAALQRGLGD